MRSCWARVADDKVSLPGKWGGTAQDGRGKPVGLFWHHQLPSHGAGYPMAPRLPLIPPGHFPALSLRATTLPPQLWPGFQGVQSSTVRSSVPHSPKHMPRIIHSSVPLALLSNIL